METVQIQCGSCHRVMAISVEHLGTQVQCPHCQTIVQAPPPDAAQLRHAPAGDNNGDVDSIFAGPAATDDIFHTAPSGTFVEMPPEKISPTLTDFSSAELPASLPVERSGPSPAELSSDVSAKANQRTDTPATWSDAAHADAMSSTDPTSVSALPTRGPKSSALAPIVLIFLVPYAILATAVIAYLLLNPNQPFDPLERLPDPKPKDGGPRWQVAHDSPLPAKLKTSLKQPLTIGALQITPLKVQLLKDELVLSLKMKNLSKDLVFNPISDEFMKFGKGSMSANRPYTYLAWSGKTIYGGFPEWLQGPAGKEEPCGGDIGPGKEELIRLITDPQYKDDVQRLAASRESLIWRVQVRRGFVELHGNPVSATAVVGVEFNAQDIVVIRACQPSASRQSAKARG